MTPPDTKSPAWTHPRRAFNLPPTHSDYEPVLCCSVFFCGLEQEPERQLNVAPIAVLVDASTEVCVGRIAFRTTQVRVIQEVENLRAELNLAGSLQREVLEERNV